MPDARVAVIGAGPCGLAACRALDEMGIDYACFEARRGVGGVWNVEEGLGGSYRSLETNTSTAAMAFSDFPFPDEAPRYPSASQMVDYFAAYAEHFDLERRIRFGRPVSRATPISDGGWRLDFGDGEARDYEALVVATGQYNTPRRPHDSIPGTFDGAQLHVFDYLDPQSPVDCRGKRVVVVGLGSSAAEVAAELADPDRGVGPSGQVLLAARSGRWIITKMTSGPAFDTRAPRVSAAPPAPLRWLPGGAGPWVMRRILAKMIRSISHEQHGGAQALGLPEPTIEPWEDRPTMSIGFVPALRAGRIDVRSGIERFDGRTVHFDDGTSTEADVVLYATGYQLGFPFLDRETIGCDAPDLALYQRIAHPDYDDLFFLGCCRVMCSMWPLAEQQAKWVARLLGGAFAVPARAARARRAIPLASTLPVMCNFYVEDLRREWGGS